jgi:CheY-like chemotaxis protein
VLVVEDEPALREVAVRGLREQGYVVLQATDGLEALRVADRYEDEIHLLLTDVVMPGMSGPKLAERLRSMRPHIRVLFTSGYTDATFPGQSADPSMEFMQKPFTIVSLGRKVHDALHRD